MLQRLQVRHVRPDDSDERSMRVTGRHAERALQDVVPVLVSQERVVVGGVNEFADDGVSPRIHPVQLEHLLHHVGGELLARQLRDATLELPQDSVARVCVARIQHILQAGREERV